MSVLTIDGSYGEGGGQVLRSALTLSALTGRPVRIERIRAGRKNPGLQAQHLTAVLATARICDADLDGACLGSMTLTFSPRRPPQAGEYRFDVAEQRQGGSAGSVTLVLHTLLLPLAWAEGTSRVTVRGGTHVAWSPPWEHWEQVYLPTLALMGLTARAGIRRYGWYPAGGGEVSVEVEGQAGRVLSPLNLLERGELRRLKGLSLYANLPPHVGERQGKRMAEVLGKAGFSPHIEVQQAHHVSSRLPEGKEDRGAGERRQQVGTGSAVFLLAECQHVVAGFSALGERGKPAERVAEEACTAFLNWYRSGAAVEMHLADQLLLPLALAVGPSTLTTCRITQHLLTNAWVVQQFLPVRIEVTGEEGQAGRVAIVPTL